MSTFVAAITFSSNASLIWLAAPILFSNRLNPQSEINFGDDGSEDGYTRWLLGRRVATEILARKMGLPLGHEVEVRLVGGMRLRGKLRLQEETMFIDEDRVRRLGLRVNKVVFTYRELESCARLD